MTGSLGTNCYSMCGDHCAICDRLCYECEDDYIYCDLDYPVCITEDEVPDDKFVTEEINIC